MYDESVWEHYYCPGQMSIFDVWPEMQPEQSSKDSLSGKIAERHSDPEIEKKESCP